MKGVVYTIDSHGSCLHEPLQQHKGVGGVYLATGHSARDIFELLHKKNITIEAKPFALGVRIEHQQSLIDSIQYKCTDRGMYLPAASYSLVEQVKVGTQSKRCVFFLHVSWWFYCSFCNQSK
jgi:uncharacterized FAD-dependent dehydrogenase